MERPTLQTVLAALKVQNLLPPHLHQDQLTATLSTQKSPTPWFVSALIAISAWLSIIPFISFLALLGILKSDNSLIFIGLFLIIGTFFLHYFQKNVLFLNHLAFALNVTGQTMFIGGIMLERDIATAALATWFLEIVVIAVYRDNLLRFLAVLIAIAAALILIYEFEIMQAIHAIIVLIAAGAAWYWISESRQEF